METTGIINNSDKKNVSMAKTAYDVQKIREDFPILHTKVYGNPLVYFDNAATTQKPRSVVQSIDQYYYTINSNVHRGVHNLSARATEAYEGAREKARQFLNAQKTSEIIFVRGVTEGINLVASSYGGSILKEGDEVLVSGMEHHSNLVPWQMICQKTGAKLKLIPVNEKGEIELDTIDGLLTERTKILAIVHVSNSLGTINPIKEIVAKAHSAGIPVIVDGAQAAPHIKIDVRDLDCDFYTISGHKMFGPTGIGVLYGKESFLEEMPPYQGGGEMIKTVSFEETVYNDLPFKFEAGTPDIAGAVGLNTAMDYIYGIGHESIAAHENEILSYGTEKMLEEGGIKLIGTANNKACVISFLMDEVHPYDAGTILDRLGIAVRTGYHCTQPLFDDFFHITGTMRASFALYNTKEEIDILMEGIRKVKKMFG